MNPPILSNPQAFYEQVWQLARQVPGGRVATYGQLAQLIPCPTGIAPDEYQAFGARWVGSAMAACPADVPWQRVINAQGKISPRFDGGGSELQRALLLDEGVEFDATGKVDWAHVRWAGPPDAWLEANGFALGPSYTEEAPAQWRLLDTD